MLSNVWLCGWVLAHPLWWSWFSKIVMINSTVSTFIEKKIYILLHRQPRNVSSDQYVGRSHVAMVIFVLLVTGQVT